MRSRLYGLVAMVVAGCTSSTSPSRIALDIAGTWQYVGHEASPTPATIDGHVAFTVDSTGTFTGDFAATVTVAGDPGTTLEGPLTGQSLDRQSLSWDVALSPQVVRRHVGTVAGDSMTGSWVDETGSGPGASGDFTAVRQHGN